MIASAIVTATVRHHVLRGRKENGLEVECSGVASIHKGLVSINPVDHATDERTG